MAVRRGEGDPKLGFLVSFSTRLKPHSYLHEVYEHLLDRGTVGGYGDLIPLCLVSRLTYSYR